MGLTGRARQWFRGARSHSFTLVMVSTAILQAVRFAGDVMLAAVTDPADYGVWKLLQLCLLFAPLLLLGLPSGINFLVPRARGSGSVDAVSELLGTGLLASTVGFALIAVATAAIAPVAPEHRLVVATAVCSFGLWGVVMGALNALERYSLLAAGQMLFVVCFIVFLPLVLVGGLAGFLVVYSIASVVAALVVVFAVQSRHTLRVAPALLPRLFRAGLPLAVIAAVFLVLVSADRLVVSKQLGVEQLGLYGLAATVAAAVMLIPQTAVQYWYPQTLRSYEESRNPYATLLECRRRSHALQAGTLGVVAFVAVLAYPMIEYLLPEFHDALAATYLLLPGLLVVPAVGMYGNFLVAVGRRWLYQRIQLFIVAVEIPLLAIVATEYGITGVAAAMSVTYGLFGLLMSLAANRSAAAVGVNRAEQWLS